MAYQYNIIDFLSTRNVVEVKSEYEFIMLIDILSKYHFEDIFGNSSYQDYRRIAIINKMNPDLFYFEYDNERGLTWYDNKKTPYNWYGIEPLKVEELCNHL